MAPRHRQIRVRINTTIKDAIQTTYTRCSTSCSCNSRQTSSCFPLYYLKPYNPNSHPTMVPNLVPDSAGQHKRTPTVQKWKCSLGKVWAQFRNPGHPKVVHPQGGVLGTIGSIFIFSNKCLEVAGDVNADRTKLQISACNGNANQLWQASTDSEDCFAINVKWANSTRCIDLMGGSQSAGAPHLVLDLNLQLVQYESEMAFRVYASPSPPVTHSYDFIPCSRKIPLSVLAEIQANNAAVVTDFSDLDSLNMNWVYNADDTIRHSNDETFCLDVTDRVDASGTKLQIDTCASGNANQLWFINVDFTIQWQGSTRCIDSLMAISPVGISSRSGLAIVRTRTSCGRSSLSSKSSAAVHSRVLHPIG